MPNGINGRELARKLRAEKDDLKVFFTSGYSAELAAKDSLLAEGHNFLAKPFSPKAAGWGNVSRAKASSFLPRGTPPCRGGLNPPSRNSSGMPPLLRQGHSPGQSGSDTPAASRIPNGLCEFWQRKDFLAVSKISLEGRGHLPHAVFIGQKNFARVDGIDMSKQHDRTAWLKGGETRCAAPIPKQNRASDWCCSARRASAKAHRRNFSANGWAPATSRPATFFAPPKVSSPARSARR